MESTVIECSNKTALRDIIGDNIIDKEGIKNGDWVTSLQDKVVLEDGDSLLCRNSYIDTKAISQDKIVVPEGGFLCNIGFINYDLNWNGNLRVYTSNNWESAEQSVKTPINYLENVTMPRSDGDNYVLCTKQSAGSNFIYIDTVQYNGVFLSQNVGGFNVVFVFQNTSGVTETRRIHLKKFYEVGSGVPSSFSVAIVYNSTVNPTFGGVAMPKPITCYVANADGSPNLQQRIDNTKGTNTFFNDTQMEDINFPAIGRTMNDNLYEPFRTNTEFTIPEGNYSAVEITELINTEMTRVSGTPSEANLTNNNLLLGVGGADNLNASINNFIQFTDPSSDVSRYGYKISTGSNSESRIVGASQFVLTFKEDTSKFSFQFLHTPLYSSADGNNGADTELVANCVAQGWTGNQAGNPNPVLPKNFFRADKNGGVALINLEPVELWVDQLGFDIDPFVMKNGKPTTVVNENCILSTYTIQSKKGSADYDINDEPASIPVFRHMPKLGKQLTGGFMGVASSFEKGKGFQSPIVLGEPLNTGQTVDKTVAVDQLVNDIDAVNKSSISAGIVTFGYFLIEVQAQFNNNFLTPVNNFRHIVAIVSRYYEKNSYTSSTSADSIVYTHKGSPVILNSFRCRILDSNKDLALNIGEDNTVYLEIVKAPKQPKKIKN